MTTKFWIGFATSSSINSLMLDKPPVTLLCLAWLALLLWCDRIERRHK